jgi:hypothetical protein
LPSANCGGKTQKNESATTKYLEVPVYLTQIQDETIDGLDATWIVSSAMEDGLWLVDQSSLNLSATVTRPYHVHALN